MTDRQPFTPPWVSPPGDTIEDLLEERGWSQRELAERTGFSPKHVNELVQGKAALTPDTARLLSTVLGSTPRFWLVREAQYRAKLQEQVRHEELSKHAGWLKQLPLSFMRQKGWVDNLRDKGAQVEACLRFFGVAGVDEWQSRYQAPLTAFRASGKAKMTLEAVATWLRKAELLATDIDCADYDRVKFKESLAAIRSLTVKDPQEFVPAMTDLCAAAGVAVVFVPAPPKCPASGATRWLHPRKAMLALSLRYKKNDHLWFSFFHEAGHILLHSKKMQFIEGIDGLDQEQENEANRFAADLLIPRDRADELRGMRAKADVRAFAASIGIAPGIVVGRMQKEGWLPFSHMNDLKVTYQWAGDMDAGRESGA